MAATIILVDMKRASNAIIHFCQG